MLTPAPANLPERVAHFTGRWAELRMLTAAQRSARDSPLLVVHGMAGVGKTALANTLAYELSDQYPDGQLWVKHGGQDPCDPLAAQAATLRRLLGVLIGGETSLPRPLEELRLLWHRHTSDRRLLVVLDDVADAEQLLALRPAGRECLTVATSRRRLLLLSRPPVCSLSLECLEPPDSRTLLARLVGGHNLASVAAIDSIRESCGDLPLAICAAVARLRSRPTWTLEHLAKRLADPALRLYDLQTDQGGLADYLDSSRLRLPTEHQQLLRLLAQAVVSTVDADFVAALAGLPRRATERLLEELVDEHLLAQPRPGHYELHPLMRVCCGSQVSEFA